MNLSRLRKVVGILAALAPLLIGTATAHPVAAMGAIAMSPPAGCPQGAVCLYRSGNGGDLCATFYSDEPGLGSCANIGPSGSIFNNGLSCGGCEDVNLYWGSGYHDAWTCLPKGHYLLFIEKDHFDFGSGLPGFGETLAYRPGLPGGIGGVASLRWTAC